MKQEQEEEEEENKINSLPSVVLMLHYILL